MFFIGTLISFAATFEDYMNCGKIFNGDVTVWEYVGSCVTGQAFGFNHIRIRTAISTVLGGIDAIF